MCVWVCKLLSVLYLVLYKCQGITWIICSLCWTCCLMCRSCICVSVWVCEIISICGWAGVLLLVCMQAPLLPGPIHSSFISGRVGGIILQMPFPSKALIDKANISKAVWKMTWRRGMAIEIPGWVDKEQDNIQKPKALCVWECQMIIWLTESPDSNAQLETSASTNTHILLLIFCLQQLSVSTTTTATTMSSPLNLVLGKRRTVLSASSSRQRK